MRIRGSLAVALATVMAIGSAGVATAHAPGVADGHIEANTNYGISPVGYSPLEGVQDGRYTDVWTLGTTAFVGSFQDPTCSRDGVYIADISDPTAPAYVGQIQSAPNTRVNDVKAIEIDGRDVLIFSHELCGRVVASTQASADGTENGKPSPSGSVQQGKQGISLYDVTDPANPEPLKKGFLKTEVHNTFPWQTEDGTFLLVVDDLNADDLWIVDISRPDAPRLLTKTGIGTWLDEGIFDLATSELFLGTFAAPLLHDVWVEYNPTTDRWEAVLSYWDAGFITLDVTDPANPVFIDDSDYLETDPVLGDLRGAFDNRPEGNAHAAVFGGDDNEFIFGGDEDFDAYALTIDQGDTSVVANDGSDTPALPDEGLTGTPTFVGLACSSIPDATGDEPQIALIERGACAFTTKAANVSAAGYEAGIVFNSEPNGCDGSVSMLVAGDIPMVSVTRGAGFSLMGLDCEGGAAVPTVGTSFDDLSMGASFVGWGYFWVINNAGATTVSGTPTSRDGSTDVGPMGTMGYYAPAELADEAFGTGAGDLSMHNLETDLRNRDRSFISWYSLGMRVVEWREGHFHDDSNGEGSYSWNIHEVGRWIAGGTPEADLELAPFAAQHGLSIDDLAGSNFWGVTQAEIDGTRYVLGSDRNTGLWIFEYECDSDPEGPLYCDDSND